MDTKRFALAVQVGGEITGAAFVDDDEFIISTRDWSQYGKYVLIDGQWIVEMGRKLEYGNSAVNLKAFNETVYGVDQRRGPWAIGYDVDRSREDISPVGDQVLLYNDPQQNWFYRRFGGVADRTYEAAFAITPSVKGLFLVRMTEDAPGAGESGDERGSEPEGDFNIRRGSPNAGATSRHCWLSLYEPSGFLSYDFSYNTTSYFVPPLDPIVGPHGQIYFQSMLTNTNWGGFYVWNRTRENTPVDVHRNDSEYVVHTALEFPVSVPDFPAEVMQLEKIYARVGAKGDSTAETFYLTATDSANGYVITRADPRNEVLVSARYNGQALVKTTDYSVAVDTIYDEAGQDFRNGDTLVVTYYSDVDYDVTVEPVFLGDERTALEITGNVREGVLQTAFEAWGEWFNVLIYNNSVEPLSVKGMTFYFSKPIEEGQTQADDAITDTTGYGVYETFVPVLE